MKCFNLKLSKFTAQKAAGSSPLTSGRIAKPLRGGGGIAAGSSGPTGGGAPGNTVARLRDEEGG